MSTRKRPVHRTSWANAIRALNLYEEVTAPEPVVRLSVNLLARAFYGSYWKAARGLASAALQNRRVTIEVAVRCWWYRVRGLSEVEIEKRWRA